MARKFFNQKVNNTRKTIIQILIISGSILGIIICFVMVNIFSNNNNNNAKITMRDSVAIEINTNYPDKTVFFEELENVKEDNIKISYADADISKIGEYPVAIKINNKTYKSILKVVDTEAPTLKLKDLTIKKGDKYTAKDFIESCTDNSKEDCKIDFYNLATDQDGNTINYDNYINEGIYTIQISASDKSENTIIESTTLTIGEGNNNITTPTTCKYGNNNYDKQKHVLASDVTENGCALDLNLYKNEKIMAPVKNLMEQETKKLKNEFSKLNVQGNITLNRYTEAILNTEGNGIVGFSLHMELIVTNNGKEEVAESYYVKTDGTRVYSINKYYLD